MRNVERYEQGRCKVLRCARPRQPGTTFCLVCSMANVRATRTTREKVTRNPMDRSTWGEKSVGSLPLAGSATYLRDCLRESPHFYRSIQIEEYCPEKVAALLAQASRRAEEVAGLSLCLGPM